MGKQDIKPSSSGGILAKDYVKPNGRVIPKGTLFQCDQEKYREMAKEGYFSVRKKRTKVKKVEQDKDE